MSDLNPSLIALNKGLDLQTPKITAEAGSVLDSLNYEQVDFQGQKRIDGFTRYDGKQLASVDEYYVIEFDSTFDEDVGSSLYVNGYLLGTVAKTDGVFGYIIPIDMQVMPDVDDEVEGVNNVYVVVDVSTGTSHADSAEDHYTTLLEIQKALREQVGPLPGPVAGLHFFKDRLFAVAGMTRTVISASDIIYPNDYLSTPTSDAYVLESIDQGNDEYLVYLSSFNADESWTTESTEVSRDGDVIGAVIASAESLAESPYDDRATFFSTDNSYQAEENGDPAGWRFHHLGWKVWYEDGNSPYGSLSAYNQNISSLGNQGPTDYSWALNLRQNVVITNKQGQVEGWKDSEDRETFVIEAVTIGEESPTTGSYDRTRSIYADAFISWDGETGKVTAPGITTAALESNPANATIPVVLVEIPD